MFIEIIKLILYITLIIIISKYMLVKILRNLAQTLDLKAQTVGNIAGIATSIPELFTVCLSSIVGLTNTSVFNIISSNLINFIQYLSAIIVNKNLKVLKNKALKIDIAIVVITILLPIYILKSNVESKLYTAFFLIFLFIFFYKINSNAHKLYLKKYDKQIEEDLEKQYNEEKKWKIGKTKLIVKYVIYLILIGILLFFIGDRLSNNLEGLCFTFNVPQYVIGILLGFGTSIPELITFFEAQKNGVDKQDEKLGVIEATNNLLTSNCLNLFIIQAIGIIISTII